MKTIYKKMLLKLSGESLMGHQGYGITGTSGIIRTSDSELADAGVQVAIVIGGGNIFRGLSGASKGFRPCQRRSDGNACDSHQLSCP